MCGYLWGSAGGPGLLAEGCAHHPTVRTAPWPHSAWCLIPHLQFLEQGGGRGDALCQRCPWWLCRAGWRSLPCQAVPWHCATRARGLRRRHCLHTRVRGRLGAVTVQRCCVGRAGDGEGGARSVCPDGRAAGMDAPPPLAAAGMGPHKSTALFCSLLKDAPRMCQKGDAAGAKQRGQAGLGGGTSVLGGTAPSPTSVLTTRGAEPGSGCAPFQAFPAPRG